MILSVGWFVSPVLLNLLPLLLLLLQLPKETIESEAFIKVTRFHVPALVRVGDSTKVVCIYELSGETLHAMKLFKDEKEFYRFQPENAPPDRKMSFQVAGVLVDLNKSNEREVVLKNVNKKTAGLYKCQVSVEGTFKSVSAEKRMNVTNSISAATRTAMLDPSGLVVGGPAAFANAGGGLTQRQQQQHRQAVQQQHHLSSSNNNNNNNNNLPSSSSSHQIISSAQEAPSAAASAAHSVTNSLVVLCSIGLTFTIFHWLKLRQPTT